MIEPTVLTEKSIKLAAIDLRRDHARPLMVDGRTSQAPTAYSRRRVARSARVYLELPRPGHLFSYTRAGGMRDVDVASDRTNFTVQCLDMHLDVVLAGLRCWMRDDSAETIIAGGVCYVLVHSR